MDTDSNIYCSSYLDKYENMYSIFIIMYDVCLIMRIPAYIRNIINYNDIVRYILCITNT